MFYIIRWLQPWFFPCSRRPSATAFFSPRRCDGKNPPPKTPSQSSQPSRIVARRGFNDRSERNLSAVSSEIGVYVLDDCPPSAPTDGFRAVVSFAFDIASPFCSIVCALRKSVFFHPLSEMQKSLDSQAQRQSTMQKIAGRSSAQRLGTIIRNC